MRILVAEDERITRSSLVRQLEGWGHTVVATEDGEAAWEQFQAGQFDLVLTDWEMPKLSGVELIARIREVSGKGYVYVVMLTSRSDKGDIVKGIEAGADDFVSKPFDREELRVRLLAGERVIRLERALIARNDELQRAGDRMRRDMLAAARVQQALLPHKRLVHPFVQASFTYVPTDELAGDALGFHLFDDRYLVAYVVDVMGHGVPAALLAVTVMHAMSPEGEGSSLLRAGPGDKAGMQRASRVISELNRRFCASDNDGRFLTMILCILDTHEGRLQFSRAGHPLPVIVREGKCLVVNDDGGPPLAIVDGADFDDVEIQLQPGDRICLVSDGIAEQPTTKSEDPYGDDRLNDLLMASAALPGEEVPGRIVDSLIEFAGTRSFIDDVSIVVVDWIGK